MAIRRRSAPKEKPAPVKARRSAATRAGAKHARPVSGSATEEVAGLVQALRDLVRSLQEVSESLFATQTSFANALFHMPRPSEFEPLVEPLREFARQAPHLLRELERGSHLAAPPDAIAPSLDPLHARDAQPSPRPGEGASDTAWRIAAARKAIAEALASLPAESEYAPIARQLRELASVSPSLLTWLGEVPKLATPLAASVARLREAERLLTET